MITILIFDEEIQIYYANDLKKGTTLKNNDRYRHIVGVCGFGEGTRIKIWLVKTMKKSKINLFNKM